MYKQRYSNPESHWACMTSIDCTQSNNILQDSLISPISHKLQEMAENLVGEKKRE